jgi:hypothetical protein
VTAPRLEPAGQAASQPAGRTASQAGTAVPSPLARARDVLASEWTKLSSLRSNRWTLGVAAAGRWC